MSHRRRIVVGVAASLAAACAAPGCTAAADAQGFGLKLRACTPSKPKALDADASVPDATWSSLYRDFFGPAGKASCTDASCHGTPGGGGALASTFVCNPGSASDCYAYLRGQRGNARRALVSDDNVARPETSTLLGVLRITTPNVLESGDCKSGSMPKGAGEETRLSDAETARVYQWIAEGAKEN